LGWPNRFSNVASVAVNFYSSGDEVLELATTNNISALTGIESFGTLSRFCWHKQELFKGRGYFFTHGFGFSNWAGWDIRQNQLTVNEISPEEAWTMTDVDFRTNTVFNCYPESMNTNVIDRATRGAHLAYGIPALTPATGVLPFNEEENEMIDMNLDSEDDGIARPNGWPIRDVYDQRWLHSDFKDVPYIFTFKFYEKVLEKGNLK
jgi:hypothetical protein